MWNDEYTAVNLEIFATQNVTDFTSKGDNAHFVANNNLPWLWGL